MSILQKIFSKFPQSCSLCFSYGSAVKKQLGYDLSKQKPVIDFIFAVNNPLEWHIENLEKNPSHYSGLRLLGTQFLANYQEKYGAGVYFNTLIPLYDLDVYIKYGVISTNTLSKDLLTWKHLYAAGRLHKPVKIVKLQNENIRQDMQKNLLHAFRTALLLLPERFNKFDLFTKITSLSYNGDFRMIFGENKNKVRNIVEPQIEEFYDLYYNIIKSSPYLQASVSKYDFEQCKSDSIQLEHITLLPQNLQYLLLNELKIRKVEDLDYIMNKQETIAIALDKCLKTIVWKSSVSQSIKNIPSAGLIKSINYSWKKALKTFN